MPDTPVVASALVPRVSVRGPYEDLAIALIGLITKVIDGQPPEVKARLWEWYIKDMEGWRALWGLSK